MTEQILTYNFPTHRRGDTFKSRTWQITQSGVPMDLTGATLCMHLKRKGSDRIVHDFAPVVSEALTGKFTIPEFRPNFSDGVYYWDFQITDADGYNATYVKGKFPITNDISRCE